MRANLLRRTLFLLALAALVPGYWLLFSDHAPTVFRSELEDMSFGWFVPLFSACVLSRERARLRAAAGEPSAAGFLLLLPSLLVGFVGVRGLQIRFEILGLVGTLLALVWIFYGRRALAAAAFPILFLLFTMPLTTYLAAFTLKLRMFSVAVAFGVLHGLGLEVIRSGTAVQLLRDGVSAFAIDVADPCSGIRSLFAMLALSVGYGYFNLPTWGRRAALVAAAIPIVILGNAVRILAIALAGTYVSADFALGPVHDLGGYLVFLVCIGLMATACGALAPGREAPCAAS